MGRMWDVMWKQLPAVGWWTELEPPTPPATGEKKLFCTEWPIAVSAAAEAEVAIQLLVSAAAAVAAEAAIQEMALPISAIVAAEAAIQ